MITDHATNSADLDKLSHELLDAFDNLFGRHPGFRPVHAKGVMCTGTFIPAPGVSNLTRAPHANQASVPVVVRFSNFAGIPTVADNDKNGAGPRGIAIRFHLGEHTHTDIIGHSENGFPTRTGEEFLEFARALAASGPDAPKPTALDSFLEHHLHAAAFLQHPKPIPTSFARESFFAVSAFKFTNKEGAQRFGRFHIIPVAGNDYLDDAAAATKDPNFLFGEIADRIMRDPIKFRIEVQLAEEGDPISDATAHWPDERSIKDFGTITLTELVNSDDPEKRKIIFDPIPRIDGLDASDDPLFQIRAALYLLSGRRRRADNGDVRK